MTTSTNIYQQWYKSIKAELLKSEPQNIAIRAESCENVINGAAMVLNATIPLTSNQLQNQSQLRYQCHVNVASHLQFLLRWPGLRIACASIKAPRTRREYEKKSKNWLNGRRAPNYSKTLFPFFITEAEQYSLRSAQHLHPQHKHKQLLYFKALFHKILAGLCGQAVSFNDQAKKAPFFCKNSVERKGKLRDILQSYATDHQYVQGFPSCSEEAVDYFAKKSNQYVAQYRQIDFKQVDTKSEAVDEDGDSVIMDPQVRDQGKQKQETASDMIVFWKAQSMELRRQITIEKQLRLKAEAERDRLQLVFDVLNNTDLHSQTRTFAPINGVQVLDLPPVVPAMALPVPLCTPKMATNSNNGSGYHDINVTKYASKLNTMQNDFPKREDHRYNNDLGQKMAAALFDILSTDS
eukprot:214330_1